MEAGDPTLAQLYRDSEQARQDTATLHIHPLNWPRHQWFVSDPADYLRHDGADRLRMKLYSLGVPYEADLETTGGGRFVSLCRSHGRAGVRLHRRPAGTRTAARAVDSLGHPDREHASDLDSPGRWPSYRLPHRLIRRRCSPWISTMPVF